MTYRLVFATLAAGLSALSASAMAQTATEGRYGQITLQAGFPDDPRTVQVRAGGALAASRLGGSGCWGYVTEEPTYVLNYQDAGDVFDLYLSAASDVDTVMMVRLPSGSFLCDDDTAGNLGPGVFVENPANGAYAIWVGTYASGAGYPDTALHISELAFSQENPFARSVDTSAAAGATLSLRAGFRNDPASIQVNQGGDVRLASVGENCWGFADAAPSARVSYRAGRFPLFISTESDGDGTIAILAPDGSWHCNDDAAGGLNPGVTFREPASGDYLVWAGTLSELGTREATLHVSEVGYAGVDNSVDVSGRPHHGSHRLRAGFSPNPFSQAVTAGGRIAAEQALAGHTVVEGFCFGFITREPTMRLTWTGDGEPLFLSATSDADTLLLVNAPDGGWWCDDDSAGSLNPGLTIDYGPNGVYDIYVATFSPEETAPATVHVSQTGWGAEALSMRVDTSLEARFGGVTLDPATASLPYSVELEAGGPLRAYQASLSPTEFCVGYISREPSYVVNWTPEGDLPFTIYMDAERDTTLAVQLPDGSWRCDDDGSIGLNAGVNLTTGAPGLYRVYAGTYGEGVGPATLFVATGEAPQ